MERTEPEKKTKPRGGRTRQYFISLVFFFLCCTPPGGLVQCVSNIYIVEVDISGRDKSLADNDLFQGSFLSLYLPPSCTRIFFLFTKKVAITSSMELVEATVFESTREALEHLCRQVFWFPSLRTELTLSRRE